MYLYMIKNSAAKLYVGITLNPNERLRYHNSKQGAKFTKYISDFKIVLLEKYKTITKARQREIQIKKWRRKKKEKLIELYLNGIDTRVR